MSLDTVLTELGIDPQRFVIVDPLLGKRVIKSTAPMRRPDMEVQKLGANNCPWDDHSRTRLAQIGSAFAVPNDFPALRDPSAPPVSGKYAGIYTVSNETRGECEVIIYSENHFATFLSLSDEERGDIAGLWANRYAALSENPGIEYIFIFENAGVGNTMPHPHGQLYAFSFVPALPSQELANCREFYERNKRCLLDVMLEVELEEQNRIVYQNEGWVAYVPPAAEWPYAVRLHPRDTITSLLDLKTSQAQHLFMDAMTQVRRALHALFPDPQYMIGLKQAPARQGEACRDWYRFYTDILPENRGGRQIKYRASVETHCGVFINSTAPEDAAAQLRDSLKSKV